MAAQLGLLGRDRETAVISHALGEATSSRSSIVIVEGEAGIGKSRLLAEAGDLARRHGMQVASARAEELDQGRPFGVMARLLDCKAASPDPRRSTIAAMLKPNEPDNRGPITVSSDPGLQFRVVDAMADLVEELTIAGPLLIGVDDLQWADPSSLLTLAAIARRPPYLAMALVVCLRPVPRDSELNRLFDLLLDTPHTRHISLRGLDPAAVSVMVAEMTQSEPGATVLSAVSRAAGNPLFIGELLHAIREDDAISILNGRSEVTDPAMSPTLRSTILRRLGFLNDRSMAALRAAAILGSGFTLSDLSVTTAQPAFELALALSDALAAHVVEEDDNRIRFRHDLIRDAIYEDLPLSVRRGLHRDAAERLANAGAPALQVAQQFSRAAVPGDATAIEWITRAARAAAAKSPSVAATLLDGALALLDPGDVLRDRVQLERASCLLLSGRIFESAEACRQLLEDGHDVGVKVPARICLAHALIAAGRAGDARTELLQVEAGAPDQGDRISATAWASLASFWTGDLATAVELAARANEGARDVGDALSLSVALAVRACVLQLEGHLDGALEQIDDAIREAERSPGRSGHRYPLHLSRGHILMDLDRLEEAATALGIGRRICADFGLRWALASHHMVGGRRLFLTGEWDDAIAEFEAGFDLARESGESLNMFMGQAVMAMISLHRNDLAEAARAAASAKLQLEHRSGIPYRGPWAWWAQALVLEAHHDIATSLSILARCWDDCLASGQRVDLPTFGPDLVRLAVAAGERERAVAACRVLEELAVLSPVPSTSGAALRCRGLAEDDPSVLVSAAEAYSRGPRVLDTALVREEAGYALLRHGHLQVGQAQLNQAIEMYEGLNATRYVLRAGAALRNTGVLRGRRGARNRPQHGWPSLTPTERTIAGLVAEGLSNPQIADRMFVSHRTVQTHLSHVFAKLDIASRVQLAAEVTRRRGSDASPSLSH